MEITKAKNYPGEGRHVVVNFMPTVVFDLDFTVPGKLTFIGTDGLYKGYQDTCDVTFVEVAPSVFMVYWQEENGMAVVHVQNWNTMQVWTNIFTPGQKEVAHLAGTISMPEPSNEQKARDLLKAIETGNNVAIGYVNPQNYKQHNLTVADGLDGFGAALAGLADYPEKAKVNIVRSFADGDYVVLQTEYNFYGPKAGFDIFRFEDGKIVEHWDNLMPYDGRPNPSGHTPFDGATEQTDLDKTEANKTLVRGFVNDVLRGEHPERISDYLSSTEYTQHNTAIADGIDGLGAALSAMAEQGIKMEYHTLHTVLGNGNFVLSVSEGAFANKPTSYYDLFRVADGKIVEHWDVIETIAPESEWKNKNGKFAGLK